MTPPPLRVHSRGLWWLGSLAVLIAICTPLGRVYAAQEQTLALTAGASTVLKHVDPDQTPQVRYDGGVRAFEVDPQGRDQLIILGLARGSGTLKITRDGQQVIYDITVTGIANPENPTLPGTAPPAMGSPPAGSGLTPHSMKAPRALGALASIAPPVKADLYSVVEDHAPTTTAAAAPVPVTVMPAQQPPPEPHKYTTDPPAEIEEIPSLDRPARLPDDTVSMMAGTARVYDFPSGIKRVSISDSKIADVQVVNPRQLMIVGHAPGVSSLVVWDRSENYVERQIRIEQVGQQQVLLDVVVAEIDRTKLEQQGIDYSVALTHYGFSLAGLPGMVAGSYSPTMQFNGAQSGLLNPSSGLPSGVLPPGGAYYPLPVSSNITYAIGGANSNVSTNSFFQFLEEHDLGKILAQPHLLANSGQQAQFLSGGEIPIIVSQALNTSIVFKEYGTSVMFVPTVVGRHEIELAVKPEVSQPDYTHQVSLNGYSVPAFVTRRAETEVRMGENQTLMIAGLMMENTTSTVKKVPYLGDMPYLGGLFRNTYWTKQTTELVMAVTPHIVRPIPVEGQLALPTDNVGPMSPEEIRTRQLPVPDASRPRF
ncbi:MAG TPA: pilus assembly protein N-terminal domain-containing protein [Candidatus Binataceae bacterium]|nr:pilus assembly protein N-terminal domain-containing protein [Candidatus Binataceae bacterium]